MTGLKPGQYQIAVFLNRSQLHVKKMNYQKVDLKAEVESVIISAELGLKRQLSLWVQVPIYRTALWVIGDMGIGLKWNLPIRTKSTKVQFFLNEGVVLPTADESVQSSRNLGYPIQGRLLNRSVGEIWLNWKNERTLGVQGLLDIEIGNEKHEGVSNNRVVQLTTYTIDHRFSRKKITPYLALVYRRETQNPSDATGGWFIQLLGSIGMQLSDRYGVTISLGGPVVVGMKGADLGQTNLGFALQWTSK